MCSENFKPLKWLVKNSIIKKNLTKAIKQLKSNILKAENY